MNQINSQGGAQYSDGRSLRSAHQRVGTPRTEARDGPYWPSGAGSHGFSLAWGLRQQPVLPTGSEESVLEGCPGQVCKEQGQVAFLLSGLPPHCHNSWKFEDKKKTGELRVGIGPGRAGVCFMPTLHIPTLLTQASRGPSC